MKTISFALPVAALLIPAACFSQAAKPLTPADIPDEVGLYLVRDGSYAALAPENVNFKTGGGLKAIATSGFLKIKLNGILTGSTSRVRSRLPADFVLRCADGTVPTDYQLLLLEIKKGGREFIAGKSGITGDSLGTQKYAIPVSFEKIGRNAYRGTLANVKPGEYGFLAPSSFGSTGMGAGGKMYTFGIE